MTYYSRDDYGYDNPNSGKPANGDTGAWGGYEWDHCPPDSLLGTTDYTSVISGQRIRVKVRAEIVELLTLVWQICDKHGYTVWANKDGENWGPWGSECRAISGTNNPSGHSKALSTDINAPYNPYSYTFQSDMPPAMVLEIEQCGFYWGGRYEGQKYDAMHFGYCWEPSDVARHVEIARSFVGGGTVPPPGGEEDDFDMARVYYKVYRMNDVDYVAAPGRFRAITSPDDYHFLASTGWIDTPHGEGQVIERNLLEYIRNEAAMGADPAGIGPIIN